MSRRSFTLVELIAVLALVGILGAVGTMGLGAGVTGFTQGKQRLDMVQKVQNALQRIMVELRFSAFDTSDGSLLLEVSEDGSSVIYPSRRDMLEHVLEKSGSEVLLDGKTLMDGVNEFEVTYSPDTGKVFVRMDIEDAGEFGVTLYP